MQNWNTDDINHWRYKLQTNEQICEIKLTQGKIALIDTENLKSIQKYKWYARKQPTGVFYAATNNAEGKVLLHMHVYLFPDLGRIRDHIDRNGLNNTRNNLRNGEGGINERNKKASSSTGELGVYKYKLGFKAVWKENGHQITKNFNIKDYSSEKEALREASSFRKRKNENAIEMLLKKKQRIALPLTPGNTRKKNKLGEQGLYAIKNGSGYYIQVSVNGKRKTSPMFYAQTHGSMEKAKEAAIKWRIETIKNRQKHK